MGQHEDLPLTWRGPLDDGELHDLAVAHGGSASRGWWDRIRPHSLGWVTVRDAEGALVGFANVAWDGCDHAFLLDPKVHPDHQHRGLGTTIVRRCTDEARDAGCEWLHVDFGPELAPFYYDACGFTPADAAGLIRLR